MAKPLCPDCLRDLVGTECPYCTAYVALLTDLRTVATKFTAKCGEKIEQATFYYDRQPMAIDIDLAADEEE